MSKFPRENWGSTQSRSNEEIIEMLKKTHGNVRKAARCLGIDPSVIRRRWQKHPEIRQICAEARDARAEEYEEKLDDHIFKFNNLEALKFKLNACHKERGYGSNHFAVDMNANLNHTSDEEIAKSLVDKFKNNLEDGDKDE